MHDPLNTFRSQVTLDGNGRGPLVGPTFAAKDTFDIEGHRAGNGIRFGSRPTRQQREQLLRSLEHPIQMH
jgi:hypothetical protein